MKTYRGSSIKQQRVDAMFKELWETLGRQMFTEDRDYFLHDISGTSLKREKEEYTKIGQEW